MLVKKKTKWYDWYTASFLIVLAEVPIILLSEKGVANPYVLWIAGVLILIVAIYVSVWLIMYSRYQKGYNFYTSPRFKRERKVVAGIGIVYFIVWIFLWLIFVINNIIRKGILMDAEGLSILVSMFYLVPIPLIIFTIYYMIYSWAFILGLRNPYYDDSLG